MAIISKLFLRLSGWQVKGNIPPDIKKCVMVAAPHTSNHDFLYARAACYILKIRVNYLIKKTWMVFPINLFFKATGGVAVERSKATRMVDSMIESIKKSKEMVIMVAPEGTRKSVKKWKTGFYYAALGANVPIVLSYLDYKNKIAGIGPVVYPTGDFKRDMKVVQEFYSRITPKFSADYHFDFLKTPERI